VPNSLGRRTDRSLPVSAFLYDFEVECRRQDWGDPAFVYDEGKDLFRWTDGRFTFSREHADWELLRKRARLSEAMYSIVARSPKRD
jgi:hypothetical protein